MTLFAFLLGVIVGVFFVVFALLWLVSGEDR